MEFFHIVDIRHIVNNAIRPPYWFSFCCLLLLLWAKKKQQHLDIFKSSVKFYN